MLLIFTNMDVLNCNCLIHREVIPIQRPMGFGDETTGIPNLPFCVLSTRTSVVTYRTDLDMP